MKPKLISKLQRLGEKVEPLRQFVTKAPGEAARLRESITLTAGQLAQLRAEIQSGIADLRADTPELVLAALRDLQSTRGILNQAGFDIAGVDYELGLGPAQRLQVHLRRTGDVPPEMLGALASANPGNVVLRSALAALRRAIEFSQTVDVHGLDFTRLTLIIGPSPTVRIAWRHPQSEGGLSDEMVAAGRIPASGPTTEPPVLSPAPPIPGKSRETPPSVLTPASAPVPSSVLVSASPEKASEGPRQATAAQAPLPPPSPARPSSITPTKTLGTDWRAHALDRFKKMPTPGKTA